jgi:hypothetical protein
MTAAYYSGLDGEMLIRQGNAFHSLGKVRNWSFSQSQAVLETTALGDTDRTLIDGVRSLSGSCSLFYYASDNDNTWGADDVLKRIMKPYNNVGSGSPGQSPGAVDLGETIRSGKVAFRLQVNRDRSGTSDHQTSTIGNEDNATPGVGNGRRYLWIQAWITNFTMTMAVGEVLSADITFESDGAAVESDFSTYG